MSKRSSGLTNVKPADTGEIPKVHVSRVQLVIFGQCASKSNRRRPSIHGGTFKSPEARAFERDFLLQVKPEHRKELGSKRRFLRGTVTVFYQSYRSDVDVELVWDLLQKAHVISNDRWIRVKHIDGARIDKERPRVEITVEEIE